MEMSKILYLVRHAESEHNAINNAFSGISNIGISVQGKVQAMNLKKFFESINIDEVYCSSLKRAIETAEILFDSSLIISYSDDLNEMNFGDYEGRYFDPDNVDDEVFYSWSNQPSALTFPNGANIVDHAENIYRSIENIIKGSDAQTIVIISHSASIRLFIAKVLGLHLDYFRRIPCNNCSITKLTYVDSFKLVNLNCNYCHD